ncbi:uncharacterized protein LOC135503614 isoform X2 [Lineus longissimus]
MSNKALNVDALLNMSPIVQRTDTVAAAAQALLVSHLKSQKHVQKAIFPNHKKDKNEEYIAEQLDWFDFEYLCTIFLTNVVSKVRDNYKIYKMANGDKAEELLNEIYESSDWKKIGFALYTLLFPDICKDQKTSLTFKDFLEDDREKWASALSDKIQESHWIYAIMRGIVTGSYKVEDYSRDMNIIFLKLHLLDPKSVMPVYQFLRKALPDLHLQLVTTDYLQAPLEWTLLKDDVMAAINKPSTARDTSHISLVDNDEAYFGLDIIFFILTDAKPLDLYTGEQADNRRILSKDKSCQIL